MPSSRPHEHAVRLLIADDDPVARMTLATALARDFHLTALAADADEAIEIAEREHPDVALLDMQMPHGGGMRATREISSRSPGTAIVIFSVDESQGRTLEVLDAGAMTYLRKDKTPPGGLAGTIGKALEAHRHV